MERIFPFASCLEVLRRTPWRTSSREKSLKAEIQKENGLSRSIKREKHGENDSPLLELRTQDQELYPQIAFSGNKDCISTYV